MKSNFCFSLPDLTWIGPTSGAESTAPCHSLTSPSVHAPSNHWKCEQRAQVPQMDEQRILDGTPVTFWKKVSAHLSEVTVPALTV